MPAEPNTRPGDINISKDNETNSARSYIPVWLQWAGEGKLGAELGPLTWGAISVDKKHKARVCLSEDIIFQNRTTEAKLGISLPSNVFALLRAYSSQTLSKQWGSERGVFSRRSTRKGFHTQTHTHIPPPFIFFFPYMHTKSKREVFGQLWRRKAPTAGTGCNKTWKLV